MTYRERRLRKAERLTEWADKRDERSDTAREQADRIAGMIPMGQPILIGHHSESRHRRDLDRINKGHERSLADSRKADEMRSRAANIQAAADRAIYTDDPDAIEALRERIATLEAQRATIKAENAAYRATHREELKGLTAYGRDKALPHPSYVLTNLGGNITRNRKRLAQLEER